MAFYRLAQEALNNVVKHARARHVVADLSYTADCVRLRIADDGCGFESDPTGAPPGHFGLSIMRERATVIGARLQIASQTGAGTTVEVTWCEGEEIAR